MVTLEFSPMFWNNPGPGGRYQVGSSGFVQSVPGSKRLSPRFVSIPEAVGPGVLVPNAVAAPCENVKLPVFRSNGVAVIGIDGVVDRSGFSSAGPMDTDPDTETQ